MHCMHRRGRWWQCGAGGWEGRRGGQHAPSGPIPPLTSPPPFSFPQAGATRLKPIDVETPGVASPAARSAARRRTVVACGVTVAAVVVTALLVARHFGGPALLAGAGGGLPSPVARAAGWKHEGPGAPVADATPAPTTHAAAAHVPGHADPTPEAHHHAEAAATTAEEAHSHEGGETHAHAGGATPHTHDHTAAAAEGHEHAPPHEPAAAATMGPAHTQEMPADADTP